MGLIIAGRLDVQEHAEKLANALQELGISREKVSVFFINPDGQHHLLPQGGDKTASPGASDAGKGAGVGAGVGAAAGAAVGSVAGPLGTVAGAGVGAYTGSLAGAVRETDNEAETAEKTPGDRQAVDRKAGLHVAVEVDYKDWQDIVALFGEHDADQIEEAEGSIKSGHWVDFNPTQPAHLVKT